MNKALIFELAAARFITERAASALPRSARQLQESSCPGDRMRCDLRGPASSTARLTCSSRSSPIPATAAEDLLEIIMRRYERASTIRGGLGQAAWRHARGLSAMLDRLLRHGHVLKCGPKSWRNKSHHLLQEEPCEGLDSSRLDAHLNWFRSVHHRPVFGSNILA